MSLGTWWAVWRKPWGILRGHRVCAQGVGPAGRQAGAGSSCVHTLDAGWEVCGVTSDCHFEAL